MTTDVTISERAARRIGEILGKEGGARILIDPVSLDFLAGAEIDFTDDLMGQSFKVNNPNATASCGCGTSFSI
jgi:iron-sulfur cluster insertion protein